MSLFWFRYLVMGGTKVLNTEYELQALNQECLFRYLPFQSQQKELGRCRRWWQVMEWLATGRWCLGIIWTTFLAMHMRARSLLIMPRLVNWLHVLLDAKDGVISIKYKWWLVVYINPEVFCALFDSSLSKYWIYFNMLKLSCLLLMSTIYAT